MSNLQLHDLRRGRWALALALVFLLLSPSLSLHESQAQPSSEVETTSCRVRHVDGRIDTQVELKRLAAPSKEWFVSGSELSDLLQVGRFWRSDARKLVLRVDDQRITFTVGARAVAGGEETLLLRQAVAMHAGEPWIPLEFLTSVLSALTSRELDFDAESMSIRLGERSTNVTGLEVEVLPDATELRLRLSSALAFRADDSRGRRLVLKIYGASLSPNRIALGRPQGLVTGVSSAQEDGYALVVIELSETARRYQSLREDGGRTLLVRVEPERMSTIPDPVPRGPHLVQTLPPEARGRRVDVRRVVVDAGHGGVDTGGTGRGGAIEKDITLAIAKQLERVLENRHGIDVVLTRSDDTNLGLIERTERANREGADLFLSLHCNAWYASSAKGVETYFLAPAQSEWDAQVARAENSTVGAAEDLDFLLWDLVQNVYIQESATLAEVVQTRMSRDLGLENRGVKQAGFRVLVGAFMPAVLVEMGFVTNSDDAAKLRSDDGQRQVAEALAGAVLDFRERMDAIREESR